MENLHVNNSSDNLVSVRSDALSRLFSIFLSVHRHAGDINTPDKQWLLEDPNNTLGILAITNSSSSAASLSATSTVPAEFGAPVVVAPAALRDDVEMLLSVMLTTACVFLCFMFLLAIKCCANLCCIDLLYCIAHCGRRPILATSLPVLLLLCTCSVMRDNENSNTLTEKFIRPLRPGGRLRAVPRKQPSITRPLPAAKAQAEDAEQVVAEAKARSAAHAAALALARVAANIVTPSKPTVTVPAAQTTPTGEAAPVRPTALGAIDANKSIAPQPPPPHVAPFPPFATPLPPFVWTTAPPRGTQAVPPAQQAAQPAPHQQHSPGSAESDNDSHSDSVLTPSSEGHRRRNCKSILLNLLAVGFLFLVIPLAIFAVPYWKISSERSTRTTSVVTKTTPMMKSTTITLPPSYGMLYSYDPDVPNPMKPVHDLCSLPIRIREVFTGLKPASVPFAHDDRMLQHRRIFCFYESQYWRDEEQYHAENIPLSYCTDVVFGTRTLYNNYTPEAKGSESSYRLQRMPITILQIGGKLRHRGQRISVYEAIGGERRDSHNFSTFLSRDASRLLIADFYTTGRKNTLQGVYIDWLHPGDNCGGPNDTDNMISFIHNLRALNLSVILAIPPEPAVVSSYDLPRAMPLVTYLVVKTHTLRLSGAVYCSGSRRYAAHVFSTVRDLLPWKQRHKLAYSISVAPDTFTAREAVMGAVSLGPAKWENYTKKAGKTHYAAICQLNVTRFLDHPECAMVHQGDRQNFKVATFAGPLELQNRMRKAYDDGMGDVPIFVYDIDLDDFKGSCPTRVMSPLIRTLAITAYKT